MVPVADGVEDVSDVVEDPPMVVVVVDEILVVVVVLEGVDEATVAVEVVVVELPRLTPVVLVGVAIVLLPNPKDELELEPNCLGISSCKSSAEAETWPVRNKRPATAAILAGEHPNDVNFIMRYSMSDTGIKNKAKQNECVKTSPRLILMRRSITKRIMPLNMHYSILLSRICMTNIWFSSQGYMFTSTPLAHNIPRRE